MKAAYYTGNKTFVIEDVEQAPPGPDEVQIDVAFCGICGTDLHAYHGVMDQRIGLHRVIGHEMSGTIGKIGADVSGWAVGDRVVVRPLDPCGHCPACDAGHAHICHNLKFIGLDTDGAFQEKWNVPAHTLHRIPVGMAMDLAAFVEPLAVAVHDVRRGRVQAGEDALVIGGGPIGMLVALVAQHAGARVSLSEINPHRLEMAKARGFDALDPRETDIGKALHDKTGGKGADVVFEVSGSQAGATAMTEAAATRGRIVMVAIHPTKPSVDLFRFFWRELEMIGTRVYEPEDYDRAIELLANGEIDCKSLVTDVAELDDIGAAFAGLDGNPTAMKIMIKVGA
jgi:(R,R)-butanediol dehydrogenase/meso-butanediol dehydrogenase/diacetyl reductase